ncbi:MAG: WG repeat-containing protein [candidate division WOR-3 bacterium]|nr:WG repeat-containing protein [candidate division WOR-3 bacterium]MCX7756893.1 WG repeat-containing protein [candidate division WOR-3 bacterium]MDW7987383.1 WG repeat-containing protein [candidate division WOR-3 bacterium]
MKRYFVFLLMSGIILAQTRLRPPTLGPQKPQSQPSERVQEILKARSRNLLKPNRFIVKNEQGKYGFINDSGEVVIPLIYEDAYNFTEGLAAVKYSNKWGYIDTGGNVHLNFQYDMASEFNSGVAKVILPEYETNPIAKMLTPFKMLLTMDEKYTLIDRYGNIIVPANTYRYIAFRGTENPYERIHANVDLWGSTDIFNNGLAFVGKKINKDTVKYGFIDKTGKLVIDCIYDDVESFQNGLARVKKDGKWGLITTNNKWVTKPEYDFIGVFSESLALFEKNGKYGYMDTEGKIVIKPIYSEGQYFSEGLARVKVAANNNYAYINKKGEIMISLEPVIDDAQEFRNGRARIRIGGRYGYIDKTGKIVIPPQFPDAYSFQDSLAQVAIVMKDTTENYRTPLTTSGSSDSIYRYGLIDINGNYVLPPQFEFIGSFVDGIALVEKNGKYGYIKKDGSYLVEPIYDFGERFKNGLAKVKINNKESYIDKNGRIVWTEQ